MKTKKEIIEFFRRHQLNVHVDPTEKGLVLRTLSDQPFDDRDVRILRDFFDREPTVSSPASSTERVIFVPFAKQAHGSEMTIGMLRQLLANIPESKNDYPVCFRYKDSDFGWTDRECETLKEDDGEFFFE